MNDLQKASTQTHTHSQTQTQTQTHSMQAYLTTMSTQQDVEPGKAWDQAWQSGSAARLQLPASEEAVDATKSRDKQEAHLHEHTNVPQ